MSETLLRNANSLLGLGRQREALLSYERYLKDRPDSAEAWHNRGVALLQLKRCDDARKCFDSALGLKPGSAQTWRDRGHAHFEDDRFEEARADYERALALNPALPYVLGYAVLSKLWCCDWRGLSEDRVKIAQGIQAGGRVIQPFANLMLSRDPAEQLRCARIWMEGRYGAPQPLWRGERYNRKRMRVAYLSGDFRTHPVSFLMEGVFARHDRTQIETIGVSFGPDDGSAIRTRIAQSFDRFIDMRGRSDFDIAHALREMEIDIAVDLMGLTADCRSGILAHRPAPVQVNYLGYPATMAVSFMDYILADRTVIGQGEESCYAEKIAYLPGSYMACNRGAMNAPPASRAEAGLPEAAIVFAAFNHSYKIAPEIFDAWMRILTRVEGSVLWLSDANPAARQNLAREAQGSGVAPQRLIFAPFVEKSEQHLARIGLADLFLDTLPCNAHSNANDALWAGVPVVTCLGSTFAGRVAASLLNTAGMPELVARSLAEYEALAVRLAQDGSALMQMKDKLARNRKTHALFGTARFTRNLESAYAVMCERVRRGERPQSFAVAEAA